MNNQKILFKISETQIYNSKQSKNLRSFAQRIQRSLEKFEYHGILKKANSNQLNLSFDDDICKILQIPKKDYSPLLNSRKLNDENYINARQKADFIINHSNIPNFPVVVEIEKSNKKTIWFDFIKIWMFIETRQAKAGILICPVNYAHRNGVWNVFDEACKYFNYLKRFAEVPTDKMNKIAIIGYKQDVKINGKYVEWNEDSFRNIKGIP